MAHCKCSPSVCGSVTAVAIRAPLKPEGKQGSQHLPGNIADPQVILAMLSTPRLKRLNTVCFSSLAGRHGCIWLPEFYFETAQSQNFEAVGAE